MNSRKKSILFIGNCQVQSLSQLYERFAGRRGNETVTFLPTYENLSDANRQAIIEADLIVEQRLDMAPKADIGGVQTSAERHFVPLLAGGFLWPFAGQPHPHNETLSYMRSGPYDAEMSDGYMNRLIAQGISADEGANQYIALDVNSVRSLDRMYELIMDRQRARDEMCGFDIANVIETHFRTERLFRTPHHPDLRIALSFTEQFFEKLSVDKNAMIAMREQIHETPFPKDMLPIHPSVARHFGLNYADENSRYRYRSEGFFSFAQYAHRYMRYEWNRELAEGLAQVDQPDFAIPVIEVGLQKSPEAAEGFYVYADLLHRIGRHGEALVAVDRAIALDASVGRYHYRRAHTLNALERAYDAAEALSKALTLDQSDPHFFGFEVHLAIHRDDLATAETAAQNAVRIAPYDASFHYLLGDVLQRQAKLEEALVSIKTAILLKIDDSTYYITLAQVLSSMGRVNEAIATCQTAISISPLNSHARAMLMNLSSLRTEINPEEASIRNSIAANPAYAGGYNRLGHLLSRLGRTVEAIDALRSAVELEPTNCDHIASLSHELTRLTINDEAISTILTAIELAPFNTQYFIHLGNLLRNVNRLKEAEIAYQRALDFDPENLEIKERLESIK